MSLGIVFITLAPALAVNFFCAKNFLSQTCFIFSCLTIASEFSVQVFLDIEFGLAKEKKTLSKYNWNLKYPTYVFHL
jgi:hypothetical protein